MTAPRVTPTDAVRIQDDLAKFWRSSRGPDFAQAWNEVRGRDGAPVFFPVPEERARAEVLTLKGARTYFVTEDMVALAEHAGATMPNEALLETDVPTPSGFVVLEGGLLFPDVRGKNVVVSALAWRRVMVADAGGVNALPALFWTFYSDTLDDRDEYGIDPDGTRSARRAWPTRYILLAEDAEEFDVVMDEDAAVAHIAAHYVHSAGVDAVRLTLQVMHKFPRALFALLNSSVATVTTERAQRAARRQLERANSPLTGDVVVIRLRRAHAEGTTPGESAVEWSRRWIVSGHWRKAWRPSVKAHRLVWIAPFVKGPEDKPLVIPRRVHVLER